MNIGITRPLALMDTIATLDNEDVLEALDRFDEAREKLEKAREERKEYRRSVSAELNPPAPSPLQSAVQTTADFASSTALLSTVGMLAAATLTSTLTPATALVLAHTAFDNLGGYGYVRQTMVSQLGLEEQTARTAVAGARILAYGASIGYGLTKIAQAAATPLANFRQAYSASADIFARRFYAGARAVWTSTDPLWQQVTRVSVAIGGSVGIVSQSAMLKAHHETSQGQRAQARGLEVDQKVKDAQEGVTGPAKRVKALRAEEAALHRSYKTMADALDINLSSG